MSTQLSRQLAQLQAEKTRGNARASFLFSAREAADYDTATIHGIGQNGLAELVQLDAAAFVPFQSDLFGEAWAGLDRETSAQSVGDLVDARVAAFARALCPYLQMRAAHKCLEWLIRRFKVHVFNIDALLELSLPHSDTLVFGRLVQLLELGGSREALGPGSASVALWHFLAPNRKAGAPLPRDVLAAQCLKDPGVLRFVAELGGKAATSAKPDTALAWWALTLTETLSRAPSVGDTLLSQLLPALVDGVRDESVPARQVAAYAVMATALAGHRAAATRPLFQSIVASLLGHASRADPASALAALAALFGGQGQHQGVVDVGSLDAGEVSLREAGAWLLSYRLDATLLAALLAFDKLPAAVAELATRRDATALTACLLHSALASSDIAKSAPTVRVILLSLPVPVLAGLAPSACRTLLAAAAAGLTAGPNAPVLPALASVLRTLAEVQGTGVEECLRASVPVPTLGPALVWASSALAAHGYAAQAPASAGRTSGVSWRLALEHPLATVRESVLGEVAEAAGQYIKGSVPAIALVPVASALARGEEDDDPWVAVTALRVHASLANAGILAVVEVEGASAPPSRLVASLLSVAAKWLPSALVRLDSALTALQVPALAAGTGAGAGAGAEEGGEEGGNRRARREQSALLRQLAAVPTSAAGGQAGEASAGPEAGLLDAVQLRIRMRAVLGARAAVAEALSLACGPLADGLSVASARTLCTALLSLMPVGGEACPAAAVLPEGVLARGMAPPPDVRTLSLGLARALGARLPILFPMFVHLAAAPADSPFPVPALLAASFLAAQLSGQADALCLPALQAAVDAAPSGPVPHPLRARLVGLLVLDTALGAACGKEEAVVALLGMPAPSPKAAKGKAAKMQPAGAAPSSAALSALIPSLAAVLGPLLRDEWTGSCTALVAHAVAKKRKRASSIGGEEVRDTLAITPFAGRSPFPLKLAESADGELRSGAGASSEEPSRHELGRRAGRAKARVQLAAGCIDRLLQALTAGNKGSEQSDPVDVLLCPSGGASLAARLLVLLLATPAVALDWGSLGPLVEAGTQAAGGSSVVRQQLLLTGIAGCAHVVGPLVATRSLLCLVGKGALSDAVPTLLAVVASGAADKEEGDAADLRRTALSALSALNPPKAGKGGDKLVHLGRAVGAASGAVADPALGVKALVEAVVADASAEGREAAATALLAASIASLASPSRAATGATLAHLVLAVARGCSDSALPLPLPVAPIAAAITALVARATATACVRPGGVVGFGYLLALLAAATGDKMHGVSAKEAGVAAAALTAALALPATLLAVADGLPLAAAAPSAHVSTVGDALLVAACRALRPRLWDALPAAASAPLLTALLLVAGNGPLTSSAAARDALAGLTLPAAAVLAYAEGTGLLRGGGEAAVLAAWTEGGLGGAGRRISSLALLAEVLLRAVQGGRVPDAPALTPRLWSGMTALGELATRGAAAGEAGEGDLQSGVEYASQQLLSLATACLSGKEEAVAGDVRRSLDPAVPARLARTATSVQTVSAALDTCAALARVSPAATLSTLLPLLGHVTAGVGAGGQGTDSAGWAALLRVVVAITPVLHATGPAAGGLTPTALLAVFAGALPSVAFHRRKALYTSLLHALGAGGVVPLGPLAALLLARAVSAVLEARAAAMAEDDGMAGSDVAPAPRLDLVADAGAAFAPDVPQEDIRDPPTAGPVPEMLSSILAGYAVPAQVAACAQLVAVAHALAAPGEREEEAELLSHVLTGGRYGGAALPAPARLALGLGLLRFVTAHVGTREFTAAAVAAGAAAAKKGPAGKEGARLQRSYLSLSERLFDALQAASTGRAAHPAEAVYGRLEDAACALLDRLSALLAPAAFAAVVGALLRAPHEGVRARAMLFLASFLTDAYGTAGVAAVPDADARLYAMLLPELAEAVAGAGSRARVGLESTALLAEYLLGGKGADAAAAPAGDEPPFTPALRAAAFAPALAGVQALLPRLTTALAGAVPGPAAAALASALPAAARLTSALGPSSLPALPSLFAAALTAGEWAVDAAAPGEDAARAVVHSAVVSALGTLLGRLPGFFSPHLPRALRLLLCPVSAGSLPTPPPYSRVDRRVRLEADGTPVLRLPGDVGNSEGVGPRASLPPHTPASTPALGNGAASAALLSTLATTLEPRIALPALQAALPWALAQGAPTLALTIRALARAAVRLDRAALRDALPLLTSFLLTAMDARWLLADVGGVEAVCAGGTGAAGGAAALDSSAPGVSSAEVEASTLLASLAMRLGDKALRPLLARLAVWAGAGEEDVARAAEEAGAEAEAGGAAPPSSAAALDGPSTRPFWAFATLCRRITYYRALTSLSSVAASALSPYLAGPLGEAAREVAAGAGAVEVPVGAKRGKEGEGEAPAKRAKGGDGAAVEAEGAPRVGRSLPYALLAGLDGAWSPSVLHEAPVPGAGSEPSLLVITPEAVAAVAGAVATVVPSTPHALRCMALGFCRSALVHEGASTAPADSPASLFSSRGVVARERLDLLLPALTAMIRLPLATTAPPVAAAPLSSLKKDKKQLREAPAPVFTPEASPQSTYAPVLAAGVPGGASGWAAFTAVYVVPFVSSLTAATRRDTLWKPVIQACLLTLRDESARVRLTGLQAAAALYSAGGDDALVLLPETLSFLSEVLADGDTGVEAAANTLLARLEAASGEDLQKFLA